MMLSVCLLFQGLSDEKIALQQDKKSAKPGSMEKACSADHDAQCVSLVPGAVGRGGRLATRQFGDFSCRLLLLSVCLLLQGLSDEDPADVVQ